MGVRWRTEQDIHIPHWDWNSIEIDKAFIADSEERGGGSELFSSRGNVNIFEVFFTSAGV